MDVNLSFFAIGYKIFMSFRCKFVTFYHWTPKGGSYEITVVSLYVSSFVRKQRNVTENESKDFANFLHEFRKSWNLKTDKAGSLKKTLEFLFFWKMPKMDLIRIFLKMALTILLILEVYMKQIILFQMQMILWSEKFWIPSYGLILGDPKSDFWMNE